jgi:hypothetical protein
MTARPSRTSMRPEEAVQAIVRLLDQSRAATPFSTFDHFNRVLAIWEGALTQVKMREWLTLCQGMEKGMRPLSEALAILIMQASDNYQDILGSVYMALSANHKWMGQYFTPYPVASMMAEMLLADLVLPTPDGRPIRFHEPCIGSGVLFLAAAEVIERRYPGAIARGEVEFYGQDLDACCVRMARLNLRLHGIGKNILITPATARSPEDRADHQEGESDRSSQLLPAPQEIETGSAETVGEPEHASEVLEGKLGAFPKAELPSISPAKTLPRPTRRSAKRATAQGALFP